MQRTETFTALRPVDADEEINSEMASIKIAVDAMPA